MSDESDRYDLVLPFLTDSPEFAAGVEIGLLWAELRDRPETHTQFVLPDNEEQVRVIADRTGYEVNELEPWVPDGETETAWVRAALRRR